MNKQQVLTRARELIEDPDSWIRFRLAESEDGTTVRTGDDNAAKFCAIGALIRSYMEHNDRRWASSADIKWEIQPLVCNDLETALPDDFTWPLSVREKDKSRRSPYLWDRVVTFNNTREHGDVLAVFDHAIENLETV